MTRQERWVLVGWRKRYSENKGDYSNTSNWTPAKRNQVRREIRVGRYPERFMSVWRRSRLDTVHATLVEVRKELAAIRDGLSSLFNQHTKLATEVRLRRESPSDGI